ncbi:uncharacterized protein KIAA1143 homolog [Asterias rubens]|uniref:uncharacterized protein KIAA1143 homolog n=1 Tax=Asterias rubens TaxID=7604 RepID=UPI0014553C90|nr:uncharacterized protein KIAA1143 homolog [Asterias rubens]
MSGRGRQSIDYVKPSEPSFLTKFKQQAGYKEGPNVDTKREVPSFDEDDDRPEEDDEKPTVVVLREGDLTQEEVDNYAQDKGTTDDNESAGKILFKKPFKRSSEESATSDLNVTSNKKKKPKRDKKKGGERSEMKEVKNKSLLSFGDDVEEETMEKLEKNVTFI